MLYLYYICTILLYDIYSLKIRFHAAAKCITYESQKYIFKKYVLAILCNSQKPELAVLHK